MKSFPRLSLNAFALSRRIVLDSEWDFVTIVETSIALPGSTRSEQIGISRFNYGRITGQTATKDSNCRRFW